MKELILNVDYYDHVGYHQQQYGKRRIKALLEKCARAGASTIFWRVSVCGKVAYWSKAGTVFDGRPASGSHNLVKILRRFDPLEVAAGITHSLGMKIYPWVTLFDDYFPGLESKFGLQHPEYMWASRDGKHYFKGVLSYAYPEVRAYQLAQIQELAGYDIDGIYLCTRSHAAHSEPCRETDYFGYEQPVVEEFKQRYGVNIREQDFDKGLWYQLKGEYLTHFLKEAKIELAKKSLALCAGIEDNCTIPGASPMARLKIDWPGWIEKGIIDQLVIGGGRDLWEERGNAWKKHLSTFCSASDKVKFYAWFHLWDWHRKYPQKNTIIPTKPASVIKRIIDSARTSYVTGLVLHETINLEEHNLWEVLT